jgi:hypothetical protein
MVEKAQDSILNPLESPLVWSRIKQTVFNQLLNLFMKKIKFAILFVSSAFVFACNKPDTPDSVPLGTIQVDINGTASTFNIESTGSFTSNPGSYGLKIIGYKKERSSSGTYLELNIISNSPITAGSYTEQTSPNFVVTGVHFVDVFFGMGGTTRNFGSTSNPMTITLNGFSGTEIKGTFKGDMNQPGGTTSTTEKLTNGIFYVRL